MQNQYFDIWPKVVRADKEAEIRIKPLFRHCAFKDNQPLTVKYVRDDGQLRPGACAAWGEFETVAFQRLDDSLVIKHFFAGEGEHAFRVVSAENGSEKIIGNFYVYSLAADLFALRPFKGDFHIHSYYSDGKESPAYVAASARKIGLDFMALTDHGLYAPSREAMAAMRDFPTDLACYSGEEVHPPHNPVHIVNFGGSFSVNDLCKNEPEHRRQVAAYEKELPAGMQDANRYTVASTEWAFDQIRAGGGVSIYCHPYWKPEERYYVCGQVNDTIISRHKCDAFEVISGFYRHQRESNALAVSRYYEERSKGKKIPAIGVSDAHGCDRDLFGWYYTVILAKSVAFADLAQGIRGLNSVAVEAVPGEFPRVIGLFRQVKYTYFLLREFFPLHDRLCGEEGRLILDGLAGDPLAKTRLAHTTGRVPALLQKYWNS